MSDKINMSVDIAGVTLKNPITVASGTFGSGMEYSEFVDLSQLGAVTTKGVANVPWPGNPTPRIAETYGGMMNAYTSSGSDGSDSSGDGSSSSGSTAASGETKLLTLSSDTSMKLTVSVDETDILSVQNGQRGDHARQRPPHAPRHDRQGAHPH